MKKLLGTLFAAAGVLFAAQAQADLTNPGFETGDLSGWTTVGDVSAVGSFYFDDNGSPNNPTAYTTTVTPMEGSWMAQLTASDAIPEIMLQATTPFTAPMTLWYRFITSDYMPFNDSFSVSYATVSNPVPTLIETLSVAGSDPDSGWRSFLLPAETTYVGFFLQNQGDDVVDSWGFVDIAPVPEPGTYGMLLAGLGLIGAMARRRMRA